jgi:hypothetical protein
MFDEITLPLHMLNALYLAISASGALTTYSTAPFVNLSITK